MHTPVVLARGVQMEVAPLSTRFSESTWLYQVRGTGEWKNWFSTVARRHLTVDFHSQTCSFSCSSKYQAEISFEEIVGVGLSDGLSLRTWCQSPKVQISFDDVVVTHFAELCRSSGPLVLLQTSKNQFRQLAFDSCVDCEKWFNLLRHAHNLGLRKFSPSPSLSSSTEAASSCNSSCSEASADDDYDSSCSEAGDGHVSLDHRGHLVLVVQKLSGQTSPLQCSAFDTVQDVQALIRNDFISARLRGNRVGPQSSSNAYGIPLFQGQQRLMFQGRLLQDDARLCDCGIASGSVLQLVTQTAKRVKFKLDAVKQVTFKMHIACNFGARLSDFFTTKLPQRQRLV